MKKITWKALAVALPLAFGTATADEGGLSPELIPGAQPMSETELAEVTGSFFDTCILCALSNTAVVGQANVSILSAFVAQGNASFISQSNN